MNLTTIASLPSGGGCKSAMTAEVAEPVVMGMDPGAGDDQTAVGFYSFEEGGLVRIGDAQPKPAEPKPAFVVPIIAAIARAHGYADRFKYDKRN